MLRTHVKKINMNPPLLTKVFTGIIIAFSAILLVGIVRGSIDTLRYFDLKKSFNELKQATHNLRKENQEIELEVHKIKTSPQYAKKILKDRFHMTEDNENIVFLED